MAWLDVALTDMRIRDYGGSYMTSYSAHEDRWLGRDFYGVSSQAVRGGLNYGRYMLKSEAWSTTNPDYSDISYDNGSIRSQYDTARLLPWMHTPLGVTYGLTHAPGYQNNTRILMWDVRVAVKSKASGLWVYYGPFQFAGGMVQSASARPVSGGLTGDIRFEPEYGYYSTRAMITDAAPHSGYLCWHGWASFIPIETADVADICLTCRTSLILHDPAGVDDREFSRHMFQFACDGYPPSNAPSFNWYTSIGWAKNKFVTARWPQSQFFVMHTMTQAQFEAPGGYPSEFAALEDGVDTPPVEPPTIVAPSTAEWQALTESAVAGWGASSVAPTASNKLRRRRGNRIWS